MEIPVHITYRHMEVSPGLEAEIRRKAEALALRSGRVKGCRVTVEAPDRHHRKGGGFYVRIALQLERGAAISRGARNEAHAHEDAYVAVREAFLAVRRELIEQGHGHGRPTGRGTPAAAHAARASSRGLSFLGTATR